MAEEDEPEPDEPTPGETDPGAGGANGWGKRFRRDLGNQRFRSSTSPRKPVARSTRTNSDEIRAAVNYLDQTERRIAVMATIFELALTLVVVVPYLVNNHKHSTSDLKTLSAVHVFLIEGIVLFLFLLIGTALRRRAFFGFASLLVGAWLVQIKALTVLGIAYVGLGMWLVVKGMRSTRGKGQGAARGPRAQPKQRRSLKGDKVLASRAAPKPNKRYTPPKPPRRTPPKKPAPVRAETPKH